MVILTSLRIKDKISLILRVCQMSEYHKRTGIRSERRFHERVRGL